MALVHKERGKEGTVETSVLLLSAGDLEGKSAIIFDDMADTCGTLRAAADAARKAGAVAVYAVVTHGVFSGDFAAKVTALDGVAAADTVPAPDAPDAANKIRYVDVSSVFADAVARSHRSHHPTVKLERKNSKSTDER